MNKFIDPQYWDELASEFSLFDFSAWKQGIYNLFPAFGYRNYRLYFVGQLISLSGTWMQIVAQGWLVLQLTHSAFYVGLISAITMLPVLLLSLFGGALVDRMSKKKILFVTQGVAMILAFVLGLLTLFHAINFFIVAILAFLIGVVSAVDRPARQAFAVELVKREDLASAIALNSAIFNGAGVIGPGIAGILIALIGTAGTFLLNGFSYIAVLIALYYIRVSPYVSTTHPHPFEAIKDGLTYAFGHPLIKNLLLLTAVTSVFGWSYSSIMPVLAQTVFGQGAQGLGYAYSSAGLGALVSSFIISIFAKKISYRKFVFGGNAIFSFALLLFSFSVNFSIALILLFFVGMGLILQFSMINTTLQHTVEDTIRGRVMSIYTLMFMGLLPFGSFLMGMLGEHFGSQIAVRMGAVVVITAGTVLFFTTRKTTT
ncbi:MAG: MFS transporter [Candidatus Levybacteria bacterium]|nr:MFS transporter [Candidatus Levybacteria bacterium]